MSVTATSTEHKHLAEFEAPLVAATPASLEGYGRLVDDYARAEIEIVTWPAPGWRPVEPGTGNEGGTTEGVFEFEWRGEVLHGRNHAVGGNYVIAWTRQPTRLPKRRPTPTARAPWFATLTTIPTAVSCSSRRRGSRS